MQVKAPWRSCYVDCTSQPKGRIMVDDVPLAELLGPALWRQQVAVVFQDYIRYELTARDNIGFGDLRTLATICGPSRWLPVEAVRMP